MEYGKYLGILEINIVVVLGYIDLSEWGYKLLSSTNNHQIQGIIGFLSWKSAHFYGK